METSQALANKQQTISTCSIEVCCELNELEALADFPWRGSASASGSMKYLGKRELNRTGRKVSSVSSFRRAATVDLPGGRGSCRTKTKLGRSLALPLKPLAGIFHSAARLNAQKSQCARKPSRQGLSLLEVVLALSILAVAAALLAQITKQATDNGLMAKKLATAQMLCDSKMSEVLAGAIPLTSTGWTEITDSGRKGTWYYQIQTVTAERPNMIGVRLSVTDAPEATTYNPELFFVVRWMIDPSLGLDTPPAADASATGSGTGSSTGGSASSSAGGVQ